MSKDATGQRGSRVARFLADPPAAAVLGACAVILGFRRADAWTNPQFWAEDGHFYERAYVTGWHSLGLPYNGYFHAVPRAIAAVAVRFDPAAVPGIFVGCAALLTLYVAALTLSKRCPLPHFAGLFALAVVLVPDTYEVFLNIVNLQWVLAAGLILLLISRDPVGRAQWLHDLAASTALGLTGPFCIILLPLFAWRVWSRRTRASAILAVLIAACALVQGYFLFTQPPSNPGAPVGPVAARLLLPAVARRIGGSLLLGSLLPDTAGQGIATVLGIVTLAAVGFLASRPGPLRTERCLLGAAFTGILGASLLRTRWELGAYFSPYSSSRYVFVPQLIAIWLLLVAACQKGRAPKIAAVISIWALLVNVPRLHEPAYADMHWSLFVPDIRAGRAVKVPINPSGWVMKLPAREK